MRLIKMLGLAAMAALAATAFVGASSASAEPEHPEIVLCKVQILKCNELKNWASDQILEKEDPETKEILITHDVEIHAETLDAEPPKLLSSLGTVECEKSLAIVTLLNKLAKLVEGHLLALTFTGNCHLGGTSCTVTVNALGGLSLTPDEEKLKAIAKSIELEKRNTNATVKCGSFINCTFSAGEKTELLVESDAEGHLLLLTKETELSGKGFLCPSTSKWDAVYHAVKLEKDGSLPLQPGLWIEL